MSWRVLDPFRLYLQELEPGDKGKHGFYGQVRITSFEVPYPQCKRIFLRRSVGAVNNEAVYEM